MTKSSSRSVALTAAAGLLAGVFAAQADAAEVSRTCIPFDQLVQTMRAEGQIVFFKGNEALGTKDKTSYEARFIYLNPETSQGYVVQARTPVTQKPECAVVASSFDNSAVYYKRQYSQPNLDLKSVVLDQSVLVDDSPAAAKKECGDEESPFCEYHNTVIFNSASHNSIPYMQGQVTKSVIGHKGSIMTLLGTPSGQNKGTGSIWYTKNGAARFGSGMTVEITEKGWNSLPTETVSLSGPAPGG